MDDEIELSRRTVLGSLGAIGVASAGAGLGTSAYFSDDESFDGNTLTAGELDLKLDWQEHYNGEPIEAYPDPDNDGIQEPFAAAPGEYVEYDTNGDTIEVGYVCEDGADTGTGHVPPTETLRTAVEDETYGSGPPLPLLYLDDVKPGDHGEITFSIHLCDNPGYVWLTGELVDADENGHTEPEADDPDEIGPNESDPQDRTLFDNEGDEDEEPSADSDDTTQEPVELLDAILASVWYDTGEDGSYGTDDDGEGDNVHQEGEVIALSGSLRNILHLLEESMVPLDYAPTGGSNSVGSGNTSFDVCGSPDDAVGPYTNSDLGIRSAKNISCEELADRLVSNGVVENGTEYVGTKVEASGLQTGTYPAANGGTIEVESVDIPNGTITLSTDFPVEAVGIKGGNQGENNYVFEDQGGTSGQFGCVLDGVAMNTPDNQEISNIEVCYDPEAPTDGNGDGNGGGNGDRECFPNSTTAYLGFKWWLPAETGNEVQGDSLSFDLGFYTEQCRHNEP